MIIGLKARKREEGGREREREREGERKNEKGQTSCSSVRILSFAMVKSRPRNWQGLVEERGEGRGWEEDRRREVR